MSTDDAVGSGLALDTEVSVATPNRTLLAVAGVTLLSLAGRLVGLGTRTMHWDEGRVGYWILRYHETGQFAYRPIIHGPFLPVVNDYVFALLGASDFAARLPVAVVGGLLPLTAWLFRDRLRDAEVVGLALFLAANPLLVYYSRFMRNDVLVAAFALGAFAFAVRALDTRESRYLYPAALSLALAFTAKENAVVYVLCYLGAGALLLDHRLVRAAAASEAATATLRRLGRDAVEGLERWGGGRRRAAGRLAGHLLAAGGLFLAVIVFFYAPRPDLWTALASPGQLPGVLEAATVGSTEKFLATWAGDTHREHPYLPFLYGLLETLGYGAGILLVFAVIGFLVDGYGDSRGSRGLVAFATYWGLASVVGYPIATDIEAPWAAVHVVVPLAVPAGVGLATVYRAARSAYAVDDAVSTGLAALVLLAAVGGVAGANAVYVDSASADTREVLQWAQPGNDLKHTLQDVETVSRHNDGTDVLFYGTRNPTGGGALFYVANESSARQPPVGGPAWHSRLPLPWYLERYGANVTSTQPGVPAEAVARDAPPVVIAYAWNRSDLAPHLEGYAAHEHDFKLWGERIVVFVDRDALAAARPAN